MTVVHDHKAREGGFLPASGPCWRWMPLSELDRSYFGYRIKGAFLRDAAEYDRDHSVYYTA